MSWCEGGWCTYGWCGDNPEIETTILAKLPSFKGRIICNVSKIANSISGKLPSYKAQITCTVSRNAQVSGKLPSFKARITILKGNAMSVSGRLPSFKGGITATVGRNASINGKLPSFQGRVYAEIATLPENLIYSCVVMNTLNGAHTEYDDYGALNSFCMFGDSYYGAGESGIKLLSAASPDVDASLTTGDIDTHKGSDYAPSSVKRDFDIFLSYSSDEDMQMVVTGDREAQPYPYAVQSERVPTGRGLNSRFYNFKLNNIGGAPFSLEHLRLMTKPVKMRVR